ncbi:hypothetical protein [Sphaerisporangium sp. TRM90804]|uniref:hypothetical protein n=1 Tax=Sphaerisporangium sp. TRM90804 TaxID=3031113 RepID=UPI002449051D|nr:hypothetical protein [Sphaerisporangium sp. TRM90804]MDH2424843.1 hypothetical protein [Sphaerisporangium sp. TRM90804]
MTALMVWCQPCMASREHVVDGQEMACTGCGQISRSTPVLRDAAQDATPPPVVAWELCDYENQMMPVGHACVGGGPPACPTADGNPCGVCPADLAAQEAHLKADEVAR